MAGYGRKIIGELDSNVTQVLADGHDADWKSGGVTLDWGTVPDNDSDTTLPDGQVIPAGVKFLRYGEILVPISRSEVQTITFSGTPATGTYTIGIDTGDGTGVQTTAAIAGTANTAAIQSAIDALSNIEPGDIVAVRASNVITLTAGGNLTNKNLADVVFTPSSLQTSAPAAVTGAVATTTQGIGDTGGMYGPHRTDASDGRQLRPVGDTWVLNRTWREDEVASDYPAVFDGGRVWEARLLVGDTNQATLAQIQAALPRLSYAR